MQSYDESTSEYETIAMRMTTPTTAKPATTPLLGASRTPSMEAAARRMNFGNRLSTKQLVDETLIAAF